MRLFNKEVSSQKVVIATATLAVLLAGGVFVWQYLSSGEPTIDYWSVDWAPGTYEYSEFAPPNQTWAYALTISKADNQFDAELDITGFQTLTKIQAVAQQRNGNLLDVIFDSYRPGNTGEVYKKGDLLFSLEKLDSKYKILWGTLKSNLLTPPVDAAFTKVSPTVSKDEPAGIQVVSPNGGGAWRAGETYQIKYETRQVDKAGVAIFLVDQSVSPWRVNDIAKDVSSTLGQLSWVVPSNTLPGTKYKILITGVVEGAKEPYSGTVGLSDESDNYFSIVSSETELKVLGTELGIVSEDERSLRVFPIENPNETIVDISSSALKKIGDSVQVHDLLYSKPLGLFVILVEELPYRGGSAGNANWSFLTFSERSRVLERILTDDGSGSFVPKNAVLSSSGLKLAYTSGLSAGGCATTEYLEGVDLKTLQPFVFEGEVVLEGSYRQAFINNLIPIARAAAPTSRERALSPINSIPQTYYENEKTWRVNFVFSSLGWENDNTLKGKYNLTICEPQVDENYQVIIRKEITRDFRVTL